MKLSRRKAVLTRIFFDCLLWIHCEAVWIGHCLCPYLNSLVWWSCFPLLLYQTVGIQTPNLTPKKVLDSSSRKRKTGLRYGICQARYVSGGCKEMDASGCHSWSKESAKRLCSSWPKGGSEWKIQRLNASASSFLSLEMCDKSSSIPEIVQSNVKRSKNGSMEMLSKKVDCHQLQYRIVGQWLETQRKSRNWRTATEDILDRQLC